MLIPLRISNLAAIFCLLTILIGRAGELPVGVTREPVVFSGGHETDPRDHGRPVVLVAAALGVPPEVFREAFSHVHPAHSDGGPSPEQARQNKSALMSVLGQYGITNDRLDAVSNYYRYRPQLGELWTNRPAQANALVKNGTVVGYEIVNSGAGYSTPPSVSVPPGVRRNAITVVHLAFTRDLETNGSIASITVIPGK